MENREAIIQSLIANSLNRIDSYFSPDSPPQDFKDKHVARLLSLFSTRSLAQLREMHKADLRRKVQRHETTHS